MATGLENIRCSSGIPNSNEYPVLVGSISPSNTRFSILNQSEPDAVIVVPDVISTLPYLVSFSREIHVSMITPIMTPDSVLSSASKSIFLFFLSFIFFFSFIFAVLSFAPVSVMAHDSDNTTHVPHDSVNISSSDAPVHINHISPVPDTDHD